MSVVTSISNTDIYNSHKQKLFGILNESQENKSVYIMHPGVKKKTTQTNKKQKQKDP